MKIKQQMLFLIQKIYFQEAEYSLSARSILFSFIRSCKNLFYIVLLFKINIICNVHKMIDSDLIILMLQVICIGQYR